MQLLCLVMDYGWYSTKAAAIQHTVCCAPDPIRGVEHWQADYWEPRLYKSEKKNLPFICHLDNYPY